MLSPDNLPRDSDVVPFRYTHVAIATAWIWDALTSFSTEVDTFAGRPVTYVNYVYFLSRFLTLVMVLCEIVTAVTPLGTQRCNIFFHFLGAIGAATTCLGTFLFLIRVRTAFYDSKRIRMIFSIWWLLAVAGVVATVPFAFSGTSLEENDFCIITKASKLEAIGSLPVGGFDSAVFISISYRVLSVDGYDMGPWTMVKAFCKGTEAGPTSKALLRTGQIYYFPMAILMTCLLIFEFSSFLPIRFLTQCQATIYLAIAVSYNIMSCRVFRRLRLVIRFDAAGTETDVVLSSMGFQQNNPRDDECTYDEAPI